MLFNFFFFEVSESLFSANEILWFCFKTIESDFSLVNTVIGPQEPIMPLPPRVLDSILKSRDVTLPTKVRVNEPGFEQTPEDSGGQGSLACCHLGGHK